MVKKNLKRLASSICLIEGHYTFKKKRTRFYKTKGFSLIFGGFP